MLLKQLINEEKPELLIGSPPCTTESAMRNLSNHKRDPEIVAAEEAEGALHLQTSVNAYLQQYHAGRMFLHEAPRGARSWQRKPMVYLASRPGVYKVTGPMCRWNMTQHDHLGEGYIRKETSWLTNCRELADLLTGVCTNKRGEQKMAQTYYFGRW